MNGNGLIACVDLEFTVNDSEDPRTKGVVEIGLALVTRDGNVVDRFSSYVNPGKKISNKTLSFLKIERSIINKSKSFRQVLHDIELWLGGRDVRKWVSWGCMDKELINIALKKHGDKPHSVFSKPYEDLQYSFFLASRDSDRRTALLDAVYDSGGVWEGNQHSALDDALNLAPILKKVNQGPLYA